jgi:hypothetical protein
MRAYVSRVREMQACHSMMTNPTFGGEHLENDARQARWTFIGLGFASILGIGLFLAAILSTHACSV